MSNSRRPRRATAAIARLVARRDRSESGDTLIEVLLAIVVLGIASVALLVAFATSISSSAEHRGLATADTVLRTAAEQAISQIQNQTNPLYASCPTLSYYVNGNPSATPPVPPVTFTGLPTGYTAAITAMQYWNAATSSFTTDQASCTPNSVQMLTITVTQTTNGATFQISFIVSDPNSRPVTSGTAAQLVFVTQPGNGPAGSAPTPQPVVAVEDGNGNVVTNDLSAVSLTIATETSSGTLAPSCYGSEFYGLVTFSGCTINTTGTYTLEASDGGLTPGRSSSFTVTAAPASQLVMTASPGGGTGGIAWAAQPQFTVEDQYGNVVTLDNFSTVSLSITTNAGTPPGTLSCTANPVTVSAGVATFAGCAIDKQGNGYVLTATDGSLTPATTGAINIAVGPAYKIGFTTSPTASATSANFPVQPVVSVEDAGGNVVTTNNSASVTLAIGLQVGTGNTLACNRNPVTATGGAATFSSCNIALGSPTSNDGVYNLTATAPGLGSATSANFTVAGPASKLVFHVSPGASTGGYAFGTQPVVWVADIHGFLVSNASPTTITLSVFSGSGALTCSPSSNTAVTSGGVATFAGCKITLGTAGPFVLNAASTPLTAGQSSSFTVAGPATQLVFSASPGTSLGGIAFAVQPVVTVEDALGQVVTAPNISVALAIGTNPSGGTLTCSPSSNVATTSSGIATFSGCSINYVGIGYTLRATATGLASATSSPFVVNQGPATQLVFTTSPSSSVAGIYFASQPTVAVEDAGGNVVTASTVPITLEITPGTPTSGGVGSGQCYQATVAATNGIANFSGCTIYTSGTGYSLTAVATGVAPGISNSFNISPSNPYQLAVTTSPGNTVAGTAFAAQPVVTVEDIYGNTVTTSSAQVSLQIGANPGGGTLTCSPSSNLATASSGVATFVGCSIQKAGVGYTLAAFGTGLQPGYSGAFNINPGPPAQLAFTVSPGNQTYAPALALNPQPVVTVQDQYGNTAVSDASTVNLAITTGTGTSGANLLGCSQAESSGVVAFSGCTIDTAGTGYTLTATDGSLTSAISSSFTIAQAANSITITSTAPASAAVGGATYPATATATSGDTVAITSATTSVCTVSSSVVSFIAVGTCTLNFNDPGNANYVAAAQVQQSFSVGKGTQAALVITSTGAAFNGTNYSLPLTTTGGSGTGAVTYALTGTGTASSCSIAGSTLTATTTGTCLVTATKAGDANWNPTTSVQTAVTFIQAFQAALTITTTSSTSNGSSFSLALATSGGSGTGAVTYVAVNGTASGCSIAGSTLTATSSGTCLVTATKAADANYLATSSAQTTVTFNKAANSITGLSAAPGSAVVNGATYTASATTTSGDTVVVTSTTTGICTVASNVVTFVGAGTCTLHFDDPGNTYYAAAATQTQSFSVGRGTQAALVITTTSATYTGSAYTLTLATSGGSGTGAVSYVAVNGTATGCTIAGSTLTATTFGTCLVTATKAADTNWNAISSAQTAVTFNQATQAALTITTTSATYNGSTYTLTLATSGGSGTGAVSYAVTGTGTASSCGIAGAVLTATTTGTCLVTATKAADTHYLAISSAQTTITFSQAAQAALTITTTSASYNGSAYTLALATSGGSGTGAVSYVAVNGTATGCSIAGSTLTASTFGTCLVTATKAADANYLATSSAQTTVTFSKAAQANLTITSTSATYNGSAYTLALTTSGGSGTGALSFAVTGTGTATGCSIAGSTLTATSSGTCLVTATKAADANYLVTASVQTTITFSKATQATLTITNSPAQGAHTGITVTSAGGSGTGGVTYSIQAGGSASGCSISGSTLTANNGNTGKTCFVYATKATDTNYLAATSAVVTFTFTS